MAILLKKITLFCFLVATYLSIQSQETSKENALESISKNCFDCHDQDTKKSNFDIESLLASKSNPDQKESWIKAWEALKNDLMPPPHKKQLTKVEKEKILAWIQKDILHYDSTKPDPGKIVIRRLNREEYCNTVNDLFDTKFQLIDIFPQDDTGFGFDNIGSVLTTSPLLIEKYISASNIIIEKIFPEENPKVTKKNIPLNQFKKNPFEKGSNILSLLSNYELTYAEDIIYEGEYDYYIYSSADQAGPDLAKMKAGIQGITTEVIEVKTPRSVQQKNILRIKLPAGKHEFTIAFLNDYYKPNDPNPKQRDRNLFIHSIYREGPFKPTLNQFSEFEKKWFPSNYTKITQSPIIETFLTQFMPLAYRRKIDKDEIHSKVLYFKSILEQTNSIKDAYKWTIQSILISPNFLFKGELQKTKTKEISVLIDELSLASRLSYFLWSSMPDKQLTDLALNNSLRKNIKSEIKRMLLDKKSESLTKNFLGQWLKLRDLDVISPSQKEFPNFNKSLLQDALRETELYFQDIINENKSVLCLLDSNYSFLNNRLAQHYDIQGVNGKEFKKVELTNKQRGGLLTQASVHLVTSYPSRTSLVLRGKYVLENFFGYTPPNPPPEMPSLADKNEAKDKTMRERIQQHASSQKCASCHAKFDPMGYALENYDAIGKWRTIENGIQINTKGTLLSGESFDGPVEFKKILMTSKKDLFTRCLIKKLLTYALGRGLQYYDEIEVDIILNNMIKNEYKFSELINGIVNSTPFQKQRTQNE